MFYLLVPEIQETQCFTLFHLGYRPNFEDIFLFFNFLWFSEMFPDIRVFKGLFIIFLLLFIYNIFLLIFYNKKNFLLKITKGTTKHKKLLQMGKNGIKNLFPAQRAKKPWPHIL